MESNLFVKDLIIFDLNGVLVEKRDYPITFRRDIENLFSFLTQKYDIAIWSAMKEKNGSKIVDIISNRVDYIFKFRWFRDKCRLDPDYIEDSEIKDYDVVKNVVDILTHPIINEKRIYNNTNILLIDDSPRKLRFNKKDNYLVISLNSDVKDIINEIENKFINMKINIPSSIKLDFRSETDIIASR